MSIDSYKVRSTGTSLPGAAHRMKPYVLGLDFFILPCSKGSILNKGCFANCILFSVIFKFIGEFPFESGMTTEAHEKVIAEVLAPVPVIDFFISPTTGLDMIALVLKPGFARGVSEGCSVG